MSREAANLGVHATWATTGVGGFRILSYLVIEEEAASIPFPVAEIWVGKDAPDGRV
jgi:hypothetical protein